MGFLPDGRVIIGDLNPDTEYFYSLMMLKQQYHKVQNNGSINPNAREKMLDDLYNKAHDIIHNKYPDLSEKQVHERTTNNWLKVPSDYYIINDVTDRLNDFMDSYTNSHYWKNITNDINKYISFYFEVKKGGYVDLKTNPDWENSLFIYNGEIVDRDALGNIVYGYLGAFLLIPSKILLWGAGVAQNQDNKTNTGDDLRDRVRIQQGIDLFKSRLKKSEVERYNYNFK